MASLLVFVFFLLPLTGWAASPCSEPVASLVAAEGRVEALSKGETQWQPARQNDGYCAEDQVQTLANSRGTLLLQNKMILRLDQKTTVRFSSPAKPSLLEMLTGRGFFFDRFPKRLTIETPFVNANVDGTEFVVEVDPEQQTTLITVFEGQVTAMNAAGSVVLSKDSASLTKAGGAPALLPSIHPKDAVAWALYYPPVLSLRELQLDAPDPSDTGWQARVRQSIARYQSGDTGNAFAEIDTLNEIDDARFYIYRASLLLSVGRVKDAEADLEKALRLSPRDGRVLSLQAIIAVVRDDKAGGRRLASAAVEAAPQLASPQVALSYAHQAHFDFPLALEAIQEAARLDPESALVSARLAEIQMSVGEIDDALNTAKKAVALNPHTSRGETVLGFAYLTRIEIAQARATFEKAVALDQADPLPRLGLGLAMIREGDLAGGRQQIEIAVGLDPNNALIRSYLGKAYYEEKQDGRAATQLDMAKLLDPKDPTPWFYDAIRKQAANRPVEALADLQKSIELNYNRAVYRSRLLLDEDLAARSASMARVYSDLGFQQLALNEGWKSLSADPSNYSAHRFLADSYAAMPRSEIGRVSELLQSQLLQPLNSIPVQPYLGESGAGILAGAGPGDVSMGEYNALFMRDGTHLLVSGIGGGNHTLGEEVIVSGLHGKYSYSLGQFHHKTDGFRENNDSDQTFYSGFFQASLTPKATLQAEVRSEETETGDLSLRFDSAYFSSTERRLVEAKTYRLGFHYRVAAHVDLIASFFYQDRGEDFTDPKYPVLAKTDAHGYNGEVQYLVRTKRASFILGGGHFEGEETVNYDYGALGDPPPIEDESRHANFYVYSLVSLPSHATLTVGGSSDWFGGLPEDKKQFNPKFGLTWNPTSSTTLRLAGFSVLKRSLVSNQTVEPTHVAGFQQFFDDPIASQAQRYGIAIDQRFSPSFVGGLELSMRDVETPILLPAANSPAKIESEEQLDRLYLYWTPNIWMGVSVEYQVERFDADTVNSFRPTVTERLPFAFSVHHPSGFFAKLRNVYVDQQGTFLNSSFFFEPGRDRFWLLDVTVGYRLSRQRGIVTVEAENLLDRQFRFYETDAAHSSIQPERRILAKINLLF